MPSACPTRASGLSLIAACLIPVLLAMAALLVVQGETILAFHPAWNDESFYWHQAATFRVAGFNLTHFTEEVM